MLAIRACASEPTPCRPTLRLPKRIARARRVAESKRLENLKEFRDALRKAGREEQRIVKEFFQKTQDLWKDLSATADDEEEDEPEVEPETKN